MAIRHHFKFDSMSLVMPGDLMSAAAEGIILHTNGPLNVQLFKRSILV
jgi:hypothetical protein